MQKCDIYHGAIRNSKRCCSVGCINDLWFIACSLNGNVVIFNRNLKKLQIINIPINFNHKEISNIVCCKESGKIFISCANFFVIFEPTYNINGNEVNNCKWEKFYEVELDFEINAGEWYCNGLRLIVSTGSFLEIYEINVYDSKLNIQNIEKKLLTKVWNYFVPSPITIISSSNDSMFFATTSDADRKVLLWYQMEDYSSLSVDKKMIFDFTILHHPTSVVGFEWREIPKEIFRHEIENCIITFCEDNIARVWKENVLNEELYVDHVLERVSDILFESSKKDEKQHKRQNYFKHLIKKITMNKSSNCQCKEKEVENWRLSGKESLNNNGLDVVVKMKKVYFYIISSIVSENTSPNTDIYGNSTEAFTPHWINNKHLSFVKNLKNVVDSPDFCDEEGDSNLHDESPITLNVEKLYNDWKETSDGLFFIDEKTGTLTIWNIFNLDSSYKSIDTKLISSIQNVLSTSQLSLKISNAIFIPCDNFFYLSEINKSFDNEKKNTSDTEDVNSNLLIIYCDGRIDILKTNIHYQSNLTFLESINNDTFLYGPKYNIENITTYLDVCLTLGSRRSSKTKQYQLEIILWKITDNNEKGTNRTLQEFSKFYLEVFEYHSKMTCLRSSKELRATFPLTFAMCYDKKLHVYEIYQNNIKHTHANKQECDKNSILIRCKLSIDMNKYGIDNIFSLHFTTPGEFFSQNDSELNYLFIIGNCEKFKNPKLILWEYDDKCFNINLVSIEYFNEEDVSNIFIIQKDKSMTGMMFDYTNYPQICLQTTNDIFYFYNITKDCIFLKNNGMTFYAPSDTLSSTIYDGKMALVKRCNNEYVLDIYECQNLNATVWKKETSFILSQQKPKDTKNVFIAWVLGSENSYNLCIQICNEVQIFSLSPQNTLLLVCKFFLHDKSHYFSMEWFEDNKFLIADGNSLELCSLNNESLDILKIKSIQYHPNYLINLIETNNYDIVNRIFKNILNQVGRYKKSSKKSMGKIYIEPITKDEIKKIISLRNEKITLDEYIEKKRIEEKNSELEIFESSSTLCSHNSSDLFNRSALFDDRTSLESEDFNIDIDSEEENEEEKDDDDEDGNKNNLCSLEDVELSEVDCEVLSNILNKIELAGLCEEEIDNLISIAEGMHKYYLIKDNIAYDYGGKKYYIFSKIMTFLRKLNNLKMYPLPTSVIVWAFHSTSENELFENVLMEVDDDVCWNNLLNYGVGWWLRHPANLKKCFEKLAQHAYLKKNNPMDSAVYYMILRKKNVIARLFRKQNDVARSNFFSQSFDTDKQRIFAMKNAFNCISKGEYLYAVAIFLCCNDIENALKVVMERLIDIQLGLMIVRTYIANVYEQERYIENIIFKYILNLTKQKVDEWKGDVKEKKIKIDETDITFVEGANDDPFTRSMAFFTIKEYYLSFLTLFHYEKISKKYPITGVGSLSCQLTTLFTLYKYLLKHPYVLRQKMFLTNDIVLKKDF